MAQKKKGHVEVSVMLTEETHEWARQRAFEAKLSVRAWCARFLEGARGEAGVAKPLPVVDTPKPVVLAPLPVIASGTPTALQFAKQGLDKYTQPRKESKIEPVND